MLWLKHLWNTLLERRRYWLGPILAMLVVAGLLFTVSAGGRLVTMVYRIL
jgi:hypothetical protein